MNKISLDKLVITQTQDADCCDSNDYQHIEISFEDGGGGHFIVIKTDRWAFDSPEELKTVLDQVYDHVKGILNPLSED